MLKYSHINVSTEDVTSFYIDLHSHQANKYINLLYDILPKVDLFFMHEKLKYFIKVSKKLFSLEFIDKLSKKSGFIKRKGKLYADKFMAFNIFSSQDMCTKSLSTLCTRFELQFNTLISPQALNERFNDNAESF